MEADGEQTKRRWKGKVFKSRNDSDEASAEGAEQAKTLIKPGSDVAETGKGGIFPVNATEFVTALGFGLFFATLQVYFGNNLMLSQYLPVGPVLSGTATVVGLAFFCITIVVCWYYSDRIALVRASRICIVGSVVLAAFIVLRYVAESFDMNIWALAIPIEVASGIAFAQVLIAWVAEIWVFQRRAAVRVMILSLCIAAGCAALVATIPASVFRYVAMAVCLVLSGFSYLAASQHVDTEEFLSREETRQNIKFDMRTSVSLFITAIAYGFSLSLAASFGEACFIVIAASFFLSAILVAVGMVFLGDRGVLLGTIFRWMYPVLTIGLVAMPFVSGIVLYICTVLALAVCFTCLISLLVTLVQVKVRFKVQPIYACARVLMPWAWGALLGLIASIAEQVLSAAMGDTTIVVFPMLIVVLLSISTAVAPYGIDMLTMPIEPDEEAEETEDESHSMHAWKSACDQLAKENGLTPREVDVFMLLAKGRNAKVIERELFISVYTIKGHNNNIYRKLGVRSQQELIDLVEQYRRELWKPKVDIEQGGEHE